MADDGAGDAKRAADRRRIALVLLLGGLLSAAAALFVDLPESHGGVKGDESTYIAMALSVAYDGDLTYERGDYDRFRGLVQSGPEGIFLKRGRDIRLTVVPRWPFVENAGSPDRQPGRLYFGKAWAHAIVAAPFVRLFGLNGLVVTNVVLLVLVVAAGWLFAATRTSPWVALGLAAGFILASVAPVYVLWLTPELLNLALVFLGSFLWFYKAVAPPPQTPLERCLCHPATDWAGVVLVGLATFSKPPNLLLIAPLLLWLVWQRRWARAAIAAGAFAAVIVAAFFLTLAVSGEANYQGGDRKTFYGHFPFDAPEATFDNRGIDMATDDAGLGEMFDPAEFWSRLAWNSGYFLVGRHFGLAPWHFPALVVVLLWLTRPGTWQMWQVGIALAVGASALGLLVVNPFSWSGGGGPLGNRYFLSIYPQLFFLLPPLVGVWSVVVMWIGGLLCAAPALAHPVEVAHRPGLASQSGLPRALPVELTMVTDLPVNLTAERARVAYGTPPNDVFLYFLDGHAWLPEVGGFWVQGGTRADVVVRSDRRPRRVTLLLRSIVANRVVVSAGGSSRTVTLATGELARLTLHIERSVHAKHSYAYVLSIAPQVGEVPRTVDPASRDERFLGVFVQVEPGFDP